MKNLQKIALAFSILTFCAGGYWVWTRVVSQPNDASKRDGPSLRDQAANPNQGQIAPDQLAKLPDAAVAAPRRFIDMTARERLDFLHRITATDAHELFQMFLDAGRVEQDPMKQSALQGKLTEAIMERKYSGDFIARMRRFVTDGSNQKLERGMVISAFAGSRTREGAEFVLWSVANQTDPELRQSAISSISGLGGDQPYLPEMIEPVWRASNDARLLNATAMAMAREAAPSSIELLVSAIDTAEGQDDKRRMAAFWALPKVYRKEAVPALASALENTPPGSLKNSVALSTLSQIGDKSAAEVVLSWLRGADDRAAPLVSTWIGESNSAAHTNAAQSALNSSVSFRSEKNREAIRTALATRSATTKVVGPNN